MSRCVSRLGPGCVRIMVDVAARHGRYRRRTMRVAEADVAELRDSVTVLNCFVHATAHTAERAGHLEGSVG